MKVQDYQDQKFIIIIIHREGKDFKPKNFSVSGFQDFFICQASHLLTY